MLRMKAQTTRKTGQLGRLVFEKNLVQHDIPTCSVGSFGSTAFHCPHLLTYLNFDLGLNESLGFAAFAS